MTFLSGRTIVITGAASGIGYAIVRQCLDAGATVVGLDVDEAGLTTLASDRPDGFLPVGADVSEAAAVSAAAEKVSTSLGAVHGLVNAAGIGGYTGDVVNTDDSAWDRTLAVNLTGVYLVSKAFLPLMPRAVGASVVHISSQYGLVGGAGSPAYCAAKSGVIGLTRAMAIDHAPEGIRVNCLCPGPIDTPMLRRSAGSGHNSTVESARTAHRTLLPAPGQPNDVAGIATFLLGPGARNITGAIVPVDGGWTAS